MKPERYLQVRTQAWEKVAFPLSFSIGRAGGTGEPIAIQSCMKQPATQEDHNEDKKKPKDENPSRGIDPEPIEPEMEAE
jgi:hypothetical protein